MLLAMIAVLVAAVLSGCSTMDTEAHRAYADAQASAAAKPTLEVDCPAGCSIAYTDPRDRRISVPDPTNGWDFALGFTNSVVGTAATLGPWYAVGAVAVEGLDAAQGDTTVRQDNDVTRTERTTTRGDTYGDGAAVAGRDQVGPNSGDQAGNSGRIDSPNSDSTSPPTVVEQPDPLVVSGSGE